MNPDILYMNHMLMAHEFAFAAIPAFDIKQPQLSILKLKKLKANNERQ